MVSGQNGASFRDSARREARAGEREDDSCIEGGKRRESERAKGGLISQGDWLGRGEGREGGF